MNIHSLSVTKPRTRALSPEITRQAIVDAALALMSERSYDGTAVPDVATRAGVAAGTIYRHFASKEALVNAVYCECKVAMANSLEKAVLHTGTTRESFGQLWRGLFQFAHQRPDAFRFLEMHRHETYLDAESREIGKSAWAWVGDFIREAQAAGAMRQAPPEMLIALTFGAFIGLAKTADPGDAPFDETTITASERAVWRLLEAE